MFKTGADIKAGLVKEGDLVWRDTPDENAVIEVVTPISKEPMDVDVDVGVGIKKPNNPRAQSMVINSMLTAGRDFMRDLYRERVIYQSDLLLINPRYTDELIAHLIEHEVILEDMSDEEGRGMFYMSGPLMDQAYNEEIYVPGWLKKILNDEYGKFWS